VRVWTARFWIRRVWSGIWWIRGACSRSWPVARRSLHLYRDHRCLRAPTHGPPGTSPRTHGRAIAHPRHRHRDDADEPPPTHPSPRRHRQPQRRPRLHPQRRSTGGWSSTSGAMSRRPSRRRDRQVVMGLRSTLATDLHDARGRPRPDPGRPPGSLLARSVDDARPGTQVVNRSPRSR
jgi:hypothetical protein